MKDLLAERADVMGKLYALDNSDPDDKAPARVVRLRARLRELGDLIAERMKK